MSTPTSVIFKGGLPADCNCPICDQALRQPIRLNCEHYYCKACFEDDARPLNCAICQTIIQPELCKYDKEKHKQIQKLAVVCSFEQSGCDWEGELSQLHSHVVTCPKRAVSCPNCHRNFAPADLEKHRQKCNQNRAVCSYCNKTIRDSDLERHMKTCPQVIISCPFQCGLVDKTRAEIENHRPNCPNVDNVCPFVPYGCTFAGDKSAIQQHLSDEPVRHLMLLCDEITELKATYEIMDRDMQTYNSNQEKIVKLSETCNEMYGPQLVWKIQQIQQQTNEAKSGAKTTLFSEPFMSHRYGYKMMACACLFGDGSSAGKALSLYVLILRGDYDPTLEWPFNRTIKISLLDQNPVPENRVNITYLVDPRKLRADEKFLARPRGERNAAFGSQSFCSLAILQNYVKDDTIYVKVEIDRCETITSVINKREEETKKLSEQFRQVPEIPEKLKPAPKSEIRVIPVVPVMTQV